MMNVTPTVLYEAANITTVNVSYCNLTEFSKSYREIHGYLSIFVCVFGSIANILNICVLTQREMRWPTNFILTGLAIADLLVMLEYIPFATHVYFDPLSRFTPDYFSYSWAVFMVFHALFTQIFHFISCCLTVLLAVWRYFIIIHPQNNKLWNVVSNKFKTKIAILLTYLLCPVVCTPLFLSLVIKEETKAVYPNGTLIQKKDLANYKGNRTESKLFVLDHTGPYKDVSVLVYGLIIKLVPCILLTLLSKRLIEALMDTKKKRRELLQSSGMPLVECNGKKASMKQRHIEKEQQTDRTTRMLVAVLLLFLITEFPQAILGIFVVAYESDEFMKQCYNPLGKLILIKLF